MGRKHEEKGLEEWAETQRERKRATKHDGRMRRQGGGRAEIQVRMRSAHNIDSDDDGGRVGRVQGQDKEAAGDSTEQAAMGPTRRGAGGRRDAWKRRRTQNGEEEKDEGQNKGRRKTQDMQGANTEPHRRSRKRKVINREPGPEKESNDSRDKANTARNRIF